MQNNQHAMETLLTTVYGTEIRRPAARYFAEILADPQKLTQFRNNLHSVEELKQKENLSLAIKMIIALGGMIISCRVTAHPETNIIAKLILTAVIMIGIYMTLDTIKSKQRHLREEYSFLSQPLERQHTILEEALMKTLNIPIIEDEEIINQVLRQRRAGY
jgi:hypothetical protein